MPLFMARLYAGFLFWQGEYYRLVFQGDTIFRSAGSWPARTVRAHIGDLTQLVS
jgi:hypothetical protein